MKNLPGLTVDLPTVMWGIEAGRKGGKEEKRKEKGEKLGRFDSV
jgi:hypothetical protein